MGEDTAKRRLFGALGALALIAASAPSSAADGASPTIPMTDDRGATVPVPSPPQRIAGISYLAADVGLAVGVKPIATTYMTAGQDPDFLLGLTRGMVQLGQRAKPNLEILAEAKPDVIVAIRRYTVANAERFAAIAPYLAYNVERYDESFQEVADLSRLFGRADRGAELNASFLRHLDEMVARVPKDRHPRFQIMWGGDTPFSFHDENTAATIVTKLGGVNILGPATRTGRFGEEVSLETMLDRDPEVIFVYDGGPERPQENNPIWAQLSAVKAGRVFHVGDPWVETNGPIAREIVLRQAAHDLYPDIFPPVDVRAEAAKIIPASLQR